MSILSTITVTLKDDAAEAAFTSAFMKALGATEGFPGLEKLIAAKVIGVDHAYHLHTVWESQEAMDSWQRQPGYRSVRDAFNVALVAGIEMSRWESAQS